MYTYPEEFIIRPLFLPTDEKYGMWPGAFFAPVSEGWKDTEVVARGQPDPCVPGSLGARSAPLGARLGRREKAFSGENLKVLKIGLCACAIMNSSG